MTVTTIERTSKRQRLANGRRRSIVQIGFFALILAIAINHSLEALGQAIPWLSAASIHGICPFGGVVSIYNFISAGTMVQKVHEASLVLMVIVLLLSVAFGPVFCGWICPMGTIQEWVSRLGRKLLGARHNTFVPASIDRLLRYLRYVVLVWVVYATAATGTLVFEAWDPYYTMFNLWSDELMWSGVAILAAVLVLSLFVERPFCKYACPFGALLGVTNLFRIFGIRRNAKSCIHCSRCDTACPMNIPVSTSGLVRDHQCISCMKCTSEQECPVPRTVELRFGSYKPEGDRV
jgi:polyferredoxin